MWRKSPVVLLASVLGTSALLGGLAGPATAAETSAAPDAAPVLLAGILPKNSDEQYELTFWESIKNSNYAGDYEPISSSIRTAASRRLPGRVSSARSTTLWVTAC